MSTWKYDFIGIKMINVYITQRYLFFVNFYVR